MTRLLYVIITLLLWCYSYVFAATVDNKPLRIVGDKAYPPFEFINTRGEPDGFNIELIREVMKRMKHPYTIELKEWDAALNAFMNNEADCMAGLIFTNNRAKNFLFSTTHNVITYYMICRKEDGGKYKTFSDLKDKQIIAPDGEIILDLLAESGYNQHILYVDDIVEGMRQLSAGKGDIAITFDEVAQRIIKQENLDNLEIIDIEIPPMEYCIALAEDDSLLLQINRTLLAMKKDGTYDDIYNKWFPSKKVKEQKAVFYASIALGLIIFSLAYFIIMYLRKKIKQATNQMLLQNKRYELLYDNTVVGLQRYDRNGILTDLNNADSRIYGIDKETVLNAKMSIFENPIVKDIINFENLEITSAVVPFDLRKNTRSDYFAISSKDELLYINLTFFPVKDAKGELHDIIVTSIDVTDKYMADLKLKESQEQLELILKAKDLLVWSYDIKSKRATYREENDEQAEWLLDVDNWIFHSEDRETLKQHFISIVNGEVTITKDVVRGITPNEGYRYFEVMMMPFKENGDIVKVLGTLKNIHEEYTMQERIKELSVNFDLALEAGDVTVWSYSPKDEIFDTIRGEVISKKVIAKDEYLDIIHPDDKEENLKIIDSLLSGKTDKASSIQRYRDSEGDYRYYKNYYIAQKEDGVTVNIIGSREDINEEISKNLELEQSIYNLKYTLKGMNAVFFEFDTRTQFFKSYNEPLNDYDENKLLTIADYISIIHPSCRERMLDLDRFVREGRQDTISIELEQKTKYDDDWRTVSLHMMPLQMGDSGAITKYVGIRNDITDLKAFSKKLLVSNNEKEMLLKNLPVVIAIYDSEARQEYMNDAGYVIFGVNDREEHMKKRISIYDDPVVPDYIKDKLRQGEDVDVILEYDIKRVNMSNYFTSDMDRVLYLDAKVRYMKDENGSINKIILIMADATSREQLTKSLQSAQDELLKTNQILNQVLDNVPCVLYIKNASNDYRYVLANKVFCQITEMTNEQMIGRRDDELFDAALYEKYTCFDRQVAETGNPMVYENTILKKGEDTHWHVVKSSLKMPNGDVYIISIATEITELKQVNAALEQEKFKAQTADKLKSAFLANMSHEIRTPLNAIVGFSELLQTSEDEAERAEYISIISHNNDLLLRLIGDILDLSKIESGMVELKPTRFDMSVAFEEAFMLLKQRCTNKNIKFISKNPYKSCLITLDWNRLIQVGTNFITNAIKYTIEGHILMGYEYVDHGIRIYVEDTGIGIPQEKQHLLFRRFAKLDDFAQGTGLGLAISKAIVDANGGKIGVESEEGKGSTFWAWIPCEAVIDEEEEEMRSNDALLPGEAGSAKAKDNRNESVAILVAEDNDSNYMLVTAILKNHNLTRAVNGAEAVELASKKKFDAILMDIRMPVMDGLEATRRIREFDKVTPIIALTANAFDVDKADAMSAGCDAFIAKPLKKKELEELLSLKHSHLP